MRKARILLMAATILATIAIPARATFPGANGRIVFSGTVADTTGGGCSTAQPADVYVMSSSGEDVRNLTESDATEADPVWSPKGDRIAVTVYPEGDETAELRVMQPDGSMGPILATSLGDLHPSWSDHGFWIAYGSTSSDYDTDIYRTRVDGSKSERVVATGFTEIWPAYAPDGERIAFITDRGKQGYDVWTVRPDGTKPKQLTHEVTFRRQRPRAYGGFSSIGWSPDGRWILFTMNKGEGSTFVYKLERNGDRMKRLGAGRYATWSPNGKTILFEDFGDGCTQNLYSMNPDGSQERRFLQREDLEIYDFDWQAR